ncbi:conserved Plasmodium protein, unknown function [Plasmodium reichenowi]|uniref:Uncharacterized protein n=1 Tax=Plasmodium reichenowi TaxID=5854 RepID=A0A060RYU9_PLARE|nr:hypothetical protein PRSY57_1407600 [Plasmodium reichenowi]KYN93741.1 hypothetical protein PRSY57_1407600 [Plasmodium reichenowi]CDO66567.1 conserved Plasmodium protein, unknown function [Plasmodium reichenowi]
MDNITKKNISSPEIIKSEEINKENIIRNKEKTILEKYEKDRHNIVEKIRNGLITENNLLNKKIITTENFLIDKTYPSDIQKDVESPYIEYIKTSCTPYVLMNLYLASFLFVVFIYVFIYLIKRTYKKFRKKKEKKFKSQSSENFILTDIF